MFYTVSSQVFLAYQGFHADMLVFVVFGPESGPNQRPDLYGESPTATLLVAGVLTGLLVINQIGAFRCFQPRSFSRSLERKSHQPNLVPGAGLGGKGGMRNEKNRSV